MGQSHSSSSDRRPRRRRSFNDTLSPSDTQASSAATNRRPSDFTSSRRSASANQVLGNSDNSRGVHSSRRDVSREMRSSASSSRSGDGERRRGLGALFPRSSSASVRSDHDEHGDHDMDEPPHLISAVDESYPVEDEQEPSASLYDVVVDRAPPSGSPSVVRSTRVGIAPDHEPISFSPGPRGTYTQTLYDHDSPLVGRSYRGSASAASIQSLATDNGVIAQEYDEEFRPVTSRDYEWMGRSIETLTFGHQSPAPILQLVESDDENIIDDSESDFFLPRGSTTTFGSFRRGSSQGASFGHGSHRSSLSLSGVGHGGTLASYYNRRRSLNNPTDVDRGRRSSLTAGPVYRRRSSITSHLSVDESEHDQNNSSKAGPNVVFSLMARESTGKTLFPRGQPASQCLHDVGGTTLYKNLDKPAAGIASEVAFLAAAIETCDWAETHAVVSRLASRLIGDPSSSADGRSAEDQNLPANAPRFYAGGGRLGLERDAFVHAGGVDVIIRMFREKAFVGQEMAKSNDARDLSKEIVAARLAQCWNEALAALRELVYFIPSLVTDGLLDDKGDFLPFLFTLLSHDSCFDGAAALIEEILSFMSQTNQPSPSPGESASYSPTGRVFPATTFFLGNVPNLYGLWRSFSCRQLAHFCRILALLVFEPEDRQLLESPAVLKSLELLQLRRNRAARAGKDSTVDMNQSILLGDPVLVGRLLQLLRVMNYAPPLRRFSSYHIMAHFPFVAETLVMLGLGELESFSETERQNRLARRLVDVDDENDIILSDLGTVAEMLEGLSDTLGNNSNNRTGAQNQIGQIIQVISAAQQAGVIVGRDRRGSRRSDGSSRSNENRDTTEHSEEDETASVRLGDVTVDGNAVQGLASVAGILTEQILSSRLYQSGGQPQDSSETDLSTMGYGVTSMDVDTGTREGRHLINTPEDAANSLQFNAMLLGPYQVEVLFVLCTLLGGRRKLDAQDLLNDLGIVSVLDDMFQRLPWYKPPGQDGDADESRDRNQGDQPNGIHGPGCECTPESALCVQYLRLLHNFCDRDCDNYRGRRLLLSKTEKKAIFGSLLDDDENDATRPSRAGLLSKIIDAFVRESDESPYRFWLASCIESFLRGSSPQEQMFAARSGLLEHLIGDISSERLHCAGSLQTSFDLLGELSKGNSEVVSLLVVGLDEERFRKLMSVAAANLVDSNVFIRSLLLSLERFAARSGPQPLFMGPPQDDSQGKSGWASATKSESRAYLTHSWWDVGPFSLHDVADEKDASFESRPSDWFPLLEVVNMNSSKDSNLASVLPSSLHRSRGHFGWVFTPAGDTLAPNAYLPNTLERLAWFLTANQARLLRDLLSVVDLRNINHENICCLNTAVVIAIFANRRQHLAGLLDELRKLNDDEKDANRNASGEQDDVVDRAFVQAMRYLDLEQHRETPSYARRASILATGSQQIGDRTDVMRNFREVLWFWMEYYTHRGRDRLSLEFSSHIRFQEWNQVVSLLAADDGSATSLVRQPIRLPRSPYQRASRVTDSLPRGV